MIKIDLENVIEDIAINESLDEYSFRSELMDGTYIELFVQFTQHPDPLLPDVFNLAFGPLNQQGEIDDVIQLHHKNLNLLFSTIFLCIITFLERYKKNSIGIDGSNDARTYLYHRMFLSNKDELSDVLTIIGVDWYVRLLRNNDVERMDDGTPYFKPRPESFNSQRKATDLYRYYLLELNTTTI